EEVLEHVVPVRVHVDDDAAAILDAVVPAGTLGGLPVALEDPVAELAADREDLAEEARVDEALGLLQAGEVELVVHDAGLDAGILRELRELDRLFEGLGGGLLGVDGLAGGDGLAQRGGAGLGHEEVGVDLPLRIGEGRVEVGRVVLDAVALGELGELGLAAADEQRADGDLGAVGQLEAALVADREDRAHEVLTVAHAPRGAVHDDADFADGGGVLAHNASLRSWWVSAFQWILPQERGACKYRLGDFRNLGGVYLGREGSGGQQAHDFVDRVRAEAGELVAERAGDV